jgi:L-threonylcarbamoyladenylate synthase
MTNLYSIITLENTENNIDFCANKIKEGSLVAFGTETVYGLGANALFSKAIEKIYLLKNRPKTNPLITHFYSIEQIKEHCYINDTFIKLAVNFMPGPISIILEKKSTSTLSNLSSTTNKIAVRIPNNNTALNLLKKSNVPIVAPSANISNTLSPTKAMHVELSFKNSQLNENLYILKDNNACNYGLESSVIEIIDNNIINILRHGSITKEDLEKAGFKVLNNIDVEHKNYSPGLLHKHYSPKTSLIINSLPVENNCGLLAFGNVETLMLPKNTFVLNLSNNGDINEAAKNLFQMLWELDQMNLKKIYVMPIPKKGIGLAINERLIKASYK